MPAAAAATHPLVEAVAARWAADEWRDATLLCAVSGGADSVAMLRILVALAPRRGAQIRAAHFDHRLRGDAGAADVDFVAELCRRLDVPLSLGSADVGELAARQRDGLEAAAREARYAFLTATARECAARFLVTAHTADDQAETILHRILRGTGLAGLAGIPQRRAIDERLSIVRPLLHVRRAEILDFLAELKQPYCTDETNADLRFTRNRLRHELLEHLSATYNPQVADALVRLSALAAEAQEVIDSLSTELLEQILVSETGDGFVLSCGPLCDRPRYLVREVILGAWRRQGWPQQAMGFAQWDRLAEMLVAPAESLAAKQRMLPGGVTVRRRRDRLEFSRATA